MTTSTLPLYLPTFCQQLFGSTAKSPAALFWSFVHSLWPWGWPLVLIGLTLWVVYEILTRGSGVHYDSANGFSPTFNRVVGSGVYLLFQAITYFFLRTIFGDGVYCTPLPYIIHSVIFGLTWLSLYAVGFWVY